MKHIKTYKIFEAASDVVLKEIQEDIKDMCLELEDDGFVLF